MQDISSSDLPNANGFLRQSVLRVLAWVQAGMAHLHFGYLDWIGRQAVPFTCSAEFLDAWAGLKGVVRKAPTAATGKWAGTGSPDGTTLPAGTVILRADGVQYTTTADATVAAGAVTASIVATAVGSNGNADISTPLTLGTVIAGINSTGSASTALTGGTDLETDDNLRTRMLQAYAKPPQGGDATDYVEWALAVPGVTRAWCLPNGSGVGSVIVYTMWDAVESTHGGFPQGNNGVASQELRSIAATGDQLAVANYIYPLRPVTALVYSNAPTPQTINFTVAGLLPATTTMQAAVNNALAVLLQQKSSPLGDTPIDQSDVDAAISATPGVQSFRVTAPSFPQTPAVGSIFVLGSVTYS